MNKKDKEVNNMKALDKVFDYWAITGIIGDKFSFHWRKENLYEEGKKTDKKDGIVTIVTEEIQQNFIKVSEWNIERCTVTNYMIQLILKI